MMCKYCNIPNDENYSYICKREKYGEAYEGMEMLIDGDSLAVFVVAPIMCGFTRAYAHYEKAVKIKYCPMCGRRL